MLLAVNLSKRFTENLPVVYFHFRALLEMKSNASFKGSCSACVSTRYRRPACLLSSSPRLRTAAPAARPVPRFYEQVRRQKWCFPTRVRGAGISAPVTCNVKQTWLRVAAAVLYTVVCSLCFTGTRRSSPGALESISSSRVSGKGFLALFSPVVSTMEVAVV